MDGSMRTRMRESMLAALMIGALMTASLGAVPREDNGNRRTKNAGTGTCAVTPNPVANGSQYTISGTGYQPGQMLDVFSGDGGIIYAQADGNGNFITWDRATFQKMGTKTVNVYEMGDRQMTVLATCSFDVY